MKKYIGIKIVDAKPMSRLDYNILRGWDLPSDENGDDEGFLKDDGNGHIQWDPKEVFESTNFPMTNTDGSTVSQEMVDTFAGVIDDEMFGDKTTHVWAETLTGFTQHEVSSCVDPKNYDHAIGVDMATNRIKNTLWQCLGFVVQWGKFGLKQ